MRFTKMHGPGNDFLVVDATPADALPWGALAPQLCDRRLGVGADGILLVGRGGGGRLRMRLVNADGSEAAMCGNGVRCAAVWAAERGLAGEHAVWETAAGAIATDLLGDGLVRVDMGAPRFGAGDVPIDVDGDEALDLALELPAGISLRAHAVGMGNPHCVVPIDGITGLDGGLYALPGGELADGIRGLGLFPAGVNVELVEVVAPLRIRQRTLERGVGETDACGTGACASVAALRRAGRIAPAGEVDVELRGGVLRVDWPGSGPVVMTGPAVTVFEGELAPPAAAASAR
jgi:diaminopimelate epimerase